MKRTFSLPLAVLVLTPASQAAARSGEPLVWTELADPDPHFVPPPEPRPVRAAKAKRRAPPAQPSMDQQAYEAGRTTAEAIKALEAADEIIARAVEQAREADQPQ